MYRSISLTALTLSTVLMLLPDSLSAAGSNRILWATVAHEHNIANSAADSEQFSDQASTVAARIRGSRATDEHHGVFWDGRLALTHYHEYDALDAIEVRGHVGHHWRLGTGFRSPWIDLQSDLMVRGHRDSSLRNRAGIRFGALLGSNLTDRWTVTTGYRYELQRAFTDEVFDTEAHRLFLNVDLILRPRLLFYLTANGIRGEVVSTAGADPSIAAIANQTSERADDAFGTGPARTVLRAYQLDADTLVMDAGLSFQINDRSSVDLGASYFHSWTERFSNYDGHSVALTFFHQPSGAR